MVFRRPSDGKVSFFLKDLELGVIIFAIKNLVPLLVGVTYFFFMEGGKRIRLFWMVDDFFL